MLAAARSHVPIMKLLREAAPNIDINAQDEVRKRGRMNERRDKENAKERGRERKKGKEREEEKRREKSLEYLRVSPLILLVTQLSGNEN